MNTWSYRSSATCWVVNGPRRIEIDFPTEKLAKEYVGFKNNQVTSNTVAKAAARVAVAASKKTGRLVDPRVKKLAES